MEMQHNKKHLPSATAETLKNRAKIIRELRNYFYDLHFVEVDTPIASRETVIDRWLQPMKTVFEKDQLRESQETFFLQTSPELGMKRLLATGEFSAIFQINKVFRNGEQGRIHNPEFTMLEWYQVDYSMQAQIQFLGELAKQFLSCDKYQIISYRDAFIKLAQVDPFTASSEELVATAKKYSVDIPVDASSSERDTILDLILVDVIQKHLGLKCPIIMYDYPASQSALAKVRREEPPVAERFELYYKGIELANGYHELLDAEVLRERNRKINQQRKQDGSSELPEPAFLLDAMEQGLPACSGVALGVDRLIMLALGLESIDQVIAFPFDRA